MCRWRVKEVEWNRSWPIRRADKLSGIRLLAAPSCAAWTKANKAVVFLLTATFYFVTKTKLKVSSWHPTCVFFLTKRNHRFPINSHPAFPDWNVKRFSPGVCMFSSVLSVPLVPTACALGRMGIVVGLRVGDGVEISLTWKAFFSRQPLRALGLFSLYVGRKKKVFRYMYWDGRTREAPSI